MADLYERLQRIRDQRRNVPAETPERSCVSTLSPGDDWTLETPGVYSRRRRAPLPPVFDRRIVAEGRWLRVSPVFRAGEELTPVFLDVETSGLSGGAGSVAFLVGLGRLIRGGVAQPHVDSSSIVEVEQLLLTDLGFEGEFTALLHQRIGDLAGTAGGTLCYVTYNGASFDLPVLRTRAIMVRRRFPEHLHLDLLAVTRRLYASRIGSCRLGAVERRVLGYRRENDIPGSEVPERYLAFLRSGDPALLDPVMQHHFHDVANLAVLALQLNAVLRREPHGKPDLPPNEFEVLRLLWDRGHQADRTYAERRMREITFREERRDQEDPGGAEWIATARFYVSLTRRRGDWTAAGAAMRRIVEHGQGLVAREDVITFAKYLEHRARDCEAALDLLTARIPAYARDPAVDHRMQRLRRKVASGRETPGATTDR